MMGPAPTSQRRPVPSLTLQEKAERAIEIRKSVAKARQGKPLTFPNRLARTTV